MFVRLLSPDCKLFKNVGSSSIRIVRFNRGAFFARSLFTFLRQCDLIKKLEIRDLSKRNFDNIYTVIVNFFYCAFRNKMYHKSNQSAQVIRIGTKAILVGELDRLIETDFCPKKIL